MSEEMTREEIARRLDTQLRCSFRYALDHTTVTLIDDAVAALRDDQPCPKCEEWEERYNVLKGEFHTVVAVSNDWASKAIAREKQCAEWERAWENMSHRLFVKYGRGFLQETIDTFDPRRKQAEEPTQRRDDGERRKRMQPDILKAIETCGKMLDTWRYMKADNEAEGTNWQLMVDDEDMEAVERLIAEVEAK